MRRTAWAREPTLPLPVEDIEHIDERRAAMGMEPLSEYRKNFEK